MLQITTGRFFKTEELNRTVQNSVLYSNLRAVSAIETEVGTYTPAGGANDLATGIYTVEQCLEAKNEDGSPSVLVAVAPEFLARDFAALLSFCLRVSCALDPMVVARLTQSYTPPVGVPSHPSKMVSRVFDREVRGTKGDASFLIGFISDLIRLERRRYKGVMRAIRRYIVGLQRIGDDLPLAYTLLVASVESLAHTFDQFEPSWQDLDEQRRRPIDQALTEASVDVRRAVRKALLGIEHVALSRRYREFVLAHLPSAFYRQEAVDRSGAARANELPEALKRAYGFRSRVVHRLEELPGMLTHAPPKRDIVRIDGRPTLTLEGLSRVARRVILRFVEVSPKIDQEDYDYRSELPGIMGVELAPQYWIWRTENYHSRSARRFLGGFLRELERVLIGDREALTDIRDVLGVVETRLPGLARRNRLPMIALYLLFHRHMVEKWHRPSAEAFLRDHVELLDSPSIESLICHAVLSQPTGWDPQEQLGALRDYFGQRYHRNGIRLGPVLETALILHTASIFREGGNAEVAVELASEAVESLPGNSTLLETEQRSKSGEEVSLNWRELLLPNPEEV